MFASSHWPQRPKENDFDEHEGHVGCHISDEANAKCNVIFVPAIIFDLSGLMLCLVIL